MVSMPKLQAGSFSDYDTVRIDAGCEDGGCDLYNGGGTPHK